VCGVTAGRVISVEASRRARHPSDTSDEQWELIEPLFPPSTGYGLPEECRRPRTSSGRRAGRPSRHGESQTRRGGGVLGGETR
jgi:hypothetical protein